MDEGAGLEAVPGQQLVDAYARRGTGLEAETARRRRRLHADAAQGVKVELDGVPAAAARMRVDVREGVRLTMTDILRLLVARGKGLEGTDADKSRGDFSLAEN